MLKSVLSRIPKRFQSTARAVDLSDWRSLISIRGKDAKALLQGVITNDISNLQHVGSMYSMFLNAKGRVYFDAILYHLNEDEILIEGDKILSAKLKKHLSMYKIRRKVKIDAINESVWHVLPAADTSCFNVDSLADSFIDPRLEKMGARVLNNPNLPSMSLEEYHAHRYKLGIPEGGEEIPFNKGFPLECNCDLMSGVSFHKGCYLGQELTARTFHTGVTRKRIVPVTLSPGNDVKDIKAKRSAGKILTMDSDGNGLAMFRTDNFDKTVKVGEEEIVITKPSWWDREGDSLEFGISNDKKHLDYYSFAENF